VAFHDTLREDIFEIFEEASHAGRRRHTLDVEGGETRGLSTRSWLALSAGMRARDQQVKAARPIYQITQVRVDHITCPRCGRPAELREGINRPVHTAGARSCTPAKT
jgi:hypothetical protein